MSPPGNRFLLVFASRSGARRALGLALSCAIATVVVQCGPRPVIAVDLSPDASPWVDAAMTAAPEAGPSGNPADVGPPPDSGMPVILNNFTNSDPSLVKRHESIAVMRPIAWLLNFCNELDETYVDARAHDRADAIGASSRYHGYEDPNASQFLSYDPHLKEIDLTDPPADAGADGGKIGIHDGGPVGGGSGGPGGPGHGPGPWGPPRCETSTKLPVDVTGRVFDATKLFSQDFAANYGIPDPTNNSRFLTLCELFEQGALNELWLMADDMASTRPPLLIEWRQPYSDTFQKVPGPFKGWQVIGGPVGTAPLTPALQAVACNVTVRIAYVSPFGDVDCDLVGDSMGMESLNAAIPYMRDNGRIFFDDELKARSGAPFDSWSDLVHMGTNGWCMAQPNMQTVSCIGYPADGVAAGTFPDGSPWRIPFSPGCGTARFPPNARFLWDYNNGTAVTSRCEHYMMGDGDGGADKTNPYSNRTSNVAHPQQFTFFNSSCGGDWQFYYRENMPGYGNMAFDTRLQPMKNWWPFLFY